MTAMPSAEMLEEARIDRIERAMRHSFDCICFAVVTPEPLAAELIDKAIELRVAVQATMPQSR